MAVMATTGTCVLSFGEDWRYDLGRTDTAAPESTRNSTPVLSQTIVGRRVGPAALLTLPAGSRFPTMCNQVCRLELSPRTRHGTSKRGNPKGWGPSQLAWQDWGEALEGKAGVA